MKRERKDIEVEGNAIDKAGSPCPLKQHANSRLHLGSDSLCQHFFFQWLCSKTNSFASSHKRVQKVNLVHTIGEQRKKS